MAASGGSQFPWLSPRVWVWLLFGLTRIASLVLLIGQDHPDQDVDWTYFPYADKVVDNVLEGRSVYSDLRVEYPPLAVIPMVAPRLVLPLVTSTDAAPADRLRSYRALFRLQILAFDILGFLLAERLARRTWPSVTGWDAAGRLATLAVLTAVLAPALFSRLDSPLTVLMLAATAALTMRPGYVLPLAILALAVAFKVVPLALAPVFVLGTIPGGSSWQRFILLTAGRSALFLGFVGAFFGGSYLALGPGAMDFWAYHRDRGIEVESLAALALLVSGDPLKYEFSFGSLNVVAPLSPTVATACTVITAVVILIVAFAYWRTAARVTTSGGETLATAEPKTVFAAVFLTLIAFVLANKVLSPQYLLWLFPFGVLLPVRGWQKWALFGLMLVCAVLTKAIGSSFSDHVVGTMVERTPTWAYYRGPDTFAWTLLAMRNLALVVLAVAAAMILVKRDKR